MGRKKEQAIERVEADIVLPPAGGVQPLNIPDFDDDPGGISAREFIKNLVEAQAHLMADVLEQQAQHFTAIIEQQTKALERAPSPLELAQKDFLTIEETAHLKGVSISTVRKAIKSGALTSRKDLGRGQRLATTEVREWKP